MIFFRLITGTFFASLWATMVVAQTYWLPHIEHTPTETRYTYDIKVPAYFESWLLLRAGGTSGELVKKDINGQQHEFIRQFFTWDTGTGGSNPAATGQIRIDPSVGSLDGKWQNDGALKTDTAMIAALDGYVPLTQRRSKWKTAEVLALRTPSDQPPGLSFVEPVPQDDQIRARLRALAENVKRGQFYPNEVQMPADIEAFRNELVALGNIGRRNPTYRKDNKYANDFSGGTVVTGPSKTEKIFKKRDTPPYFDDLGVDAKLSEACQFMAEYYAKTNGNETMNTPADKHLGPAAPYNGAVLRELGDRIQHFADNQQTAGEGLAGPGPADMCPDCWMRTETHYRPWFSIEYDVKSIGVGAARTDKGWYFCKIGGLSDGTIAVSVTASPGTAQGGAQPSQPATVAQTNTNPSTAAVGANTGVQKEAATDKLSEVVTGEWLKKGHRYLSDDGKTYLEHQDDNNLVIKRSADDGFLWGLNEQPNIDYGHADKVGLSADGRLVAYDKDMNEIWVHLDKRPDPLNRLYLWADGNLEMMADAQPFPLSSGSIIPYKRLALNPGAELAVGERFYGYGPDYYATLQADGNFVVYSMTVPPQYHWGLNEIPGVNLGAIKRIKFTDDGRFVALDANGAEVWGVPTTGAGPNSLLTLTEQGALQVMHESSSANVSREVAWSSK